MCGPSGPFLLVYARFAGTFFPMKMHVAVCGLMVFGTLPYAPPVSAAADDRATPAFAPSGDFAEAVGSYLKGSVADLAGNPEEASRSYLSALAEDPDNLSLRERVLELTLMGGDIPTSIRLAKSLPEVEHNTMSRLVLALDDAHSGKIKEARKTMRKAAKGAPGLLQFELMRVYLDFADGAKVDKLVSELEKLPVPASLAGRKQFHIGRLWLKAGRPDKALAVLEAARAKEPNALFTTLLLGQVYMQQGATDKAAALFDAFRSANPAVGVMIPTGDALVARGVVPFAATLDQDMAAAMFDFSLVVWSEGGLGPARQLMNLALWLAPGQDFYHYYAGILLEMGGDYEAAEKVYRALLANADMARGVRLRLAEVHERMGRLDDAWDEITALSKQYPEDVSVRRSVAQMAFMRQDFDRAADEYSALLEALPATASPKARVELLFARGAAYERDRDYRRAEADLKRALEIDPANAQILNYLGYMWVDRGEHLAEAFELLKKAHLLAPDDGAISDSLGWAYFKAGDYEAAVRYLELAAEQEPEGAEIADHLGDAYARLDRPMEARKFWRLAVELVQKGAEVPYPEFKQKVQDKLEQ